MSIMRRVYKEAFKGNEIPEDDNPWGDIAFVIGLFAMATGAATIVGTMMVTVFGS